MKISRKLQRQVEIKIRHSMATGVLPVVERNSVNDPKPTTDKTGSDLEPGK